MPNIKFAEGCAWRAIYVYRANGAMAVSIGIDPTFYGNRARLFGSIGFRRDCTGGRRATWTWELPLWRSRHWWRLDGRYGTFRRERAS